jgi:hypothetical protein
MKTFFRRLLRRGYSKDYLLPLFAKANKNAQQHLRCTPEEFKVMQDKKLENLSKDPVVSFFIYNTTPLTQTLRSFNEYGESKSCSPLANAHSTNLQITTTTRSPSTDLPSHTAVHLTSATCFLLENSTKDGGQKSRHLFNQKTF